MAVPLDDLDVAHIGVWGYEAGGYLAALLGTTGDVKELEGDEGTADQSSRVQAVAVFAGASDLTRLPSSYASGDDPPFLVVHGTADTRTPARQAELFVAALKGAGVDASLELRLGASDQLGSLLTLPMLETTATFFERLNDVKPPAALSAFLPSPPDAWLDPVAIDLGGTLYKTCATPARGLEFYGRVFGAAPGRHLPAP